MVYCCKILVCKKVKIDDVLDIVLKGVENCNQNTVALFLSLSITTTVGFQKSSA